MKNFALPRSRFGVFLFLFVLLSSVISSLSYVSAQQISHKIAHVEDEVLVRFRGDVHDYDKVLVHSKARATRQRVFKHIQGLEQVKLHPGVSVKEAIRSYRLDPDVLYAEPNYIVRALVTPNDPQFSQLWGLHNTGQSGGVVDADIDAPEAWNITTGSSNVVVAVIDTGIDYNHQDLAANMFRNEADCNGNGTDDDGNGFVDDCFGIDTANNDADPMDDVDHGTHVAGTIGAAGNNSVGVVGVNWNVRIMACKFLDETGFGAISDAIDCLNYIAAMKDRGVNIVATNNSWGGTGFSQALFDAIQAHLNRGILFIAAAGNELTDNDASANYPCNYYLPNVICVAATTRNDTLAVFSNWGRRTVHIGAPGLAILSTTPGNTYSTFNGTSMATPHVTGVAALLKAQDPNRSWSTIKNLILAGGDPNSLLTLNTVTGKRLNANRALTCSNSVVTSRLKPVGNAIIGSIGVPIDLAVLNINCGNPNGNVNVTVNPGGQVVTLLDNGAGTDQVANDGIYSGTWTPSGQGTFTLAFPDGSVIVTVSPNYTYAPTAFVYRTISTNIGQSLSDDSSATISAPFPIRFAGGSFSNLYVSSNGNINFTGPFIEFDNTQLPTAQVATLVAPFWDDLYPVGSTFQNVFWAVTGVSPDRELIIEWRDVRHFSCNTDGAATVKFQVVFFESSSDILFNYADVFFGGGCTGADRGGLATVGVQVNENSATQYSFNAPTLNNNTAILWTLQSPVTISVTPSSGSGSSQNFGFVFSDPSGFGDIASAQILLNSSLSAAGACYIYYSPASNAVWLQNDSGSAWMGPLLLGSGSTLQNSQCTVNGTSSSAAGSGNNLSLNLGLTFTSTFAGAKNIYALVYDNGGFNTTWQQKGRWTVLSGNQAPSVVSVTPSSGTGSSQNFSFLFSDPNGFADLNSAQVLINSTISGAAACYLYYHRLSNAVWLQNDGGSGWIGPSVLSSGSALNNSQCTVDVGSSSASGSGNDLTLSLALTFTSGFGGNKNIYAFVQDNGGLNSGWQQKGTWTVPGGIANQAPSVMSVTPSSGSGSSQAFSFVFSDANGFTDVNSAQLLINSSLSVAGGCYIYYSRAASAVWLLNDSGSAWMGPSVFGSGAALNNSQCTVDVGSSSASGSGNDLTLSLALTFTSGFGGNKNIYAFVQDNGGLSSEWQQKGTWSVSQTAFN